MKTKFSIPVILAILLSSCAPKIALQGDYFTSNSKTGVFFDIQNIGTQRTGGQGLLDVALTQGVKYEEALKVVDKKLLVQDKVQKVYNQIYSSKGRELKVISDTLFPKGPIKFNAPAKSDKKYAKYDFRSLKSKYGIDELLVVRVDYGLLVSYYSMIETGRSGNCTIMTEIVNLDDNSFIYRDASNSAQKISGKWKAPPKYDKLYTSINTAVNQSIISEKNKFK